jgi:predicted short-subunit dehydrogenase-like oxidoreductase (DUF2520 family)
MGSRTVRVVGRGRAGGSFSRALEGAGWAVDTISGRDPSLAEAASGVDVVLLCVLDQHVEEVAERIDRGDAVVAHVSGSHGLEVLSSQSRRAAVHPLVALPNAEVGAARLRAGATFAVAGDAIAREVVEALGGHAIDVPDESRAAYHAAAAIASNHLVGLLGQAERVAATAGLDLAVYLDLVRATVDNVATLGPAAALTGPAAREDHATIERHLGALDESEREAYMVMVEQCRRLVREGRS